MVFNLFKKKNTPAIALDIGSQNTKIIKTSSARNQLHIEECQCHPTPPGVFEAGQILDAKKLSDFLAKIIADMHLGDNLNVTTGVSGKGVIVKKIDIPKIEESLIAEHLPFEVEQYIPYDISEMDLDYEILNSEEGTSEEHISILFVAVLKKVVSDINQVFGEAYINCSILDTNIFALANAFEHSYGVRENQNFMICDVGASHTLLVVVSNNQVIFARSLPVGGSFYTKGLHQKLDVSLESAEEMKKDVNLEDITAQLEGLHQEFCDEIYSGYEFYMNFFPNKPISEAFITGGASQTQGLISFLEKKFTLRFRNFNTFQNASMDSDLKNQEQALNPYSAVAMGFALRANEE